MNKHFIFYHIFFETNWFDIVSEQLLRIHNSGLLKNSELKIGVVFGAGIDKDSAIEKLNSILEQYYNYEVLYVEPTGSCGEATTLSRLSDFCFSVNENSKILYLHTKGITQHNSIREKPVAEWRRMMEYFLVDNWGQCITKLDSGYDCCGINYQDHAANIKGETKLIKIYNGNFFWVNSNYIKKLDKSVLFEHRYSAENWLLNLEEHKAFSFLNVPPSFDLYYNVYGDYKILG